MTDNLHNEQRDRFVEFQGLCRHLTCISNYFCQLLYVLGTGPLPHMTVRHAHENIFCCMIKLTYSWLYLVTIL